MAALTAIGDLDAGDFFDLLEQLEPAELGAMCKYVWMMKVIIAYCDHWRT